MSGTGPMRTYARASVRDRARQILWALRGRDDLETHVRFLHTRLQRHEACMAAALGNPVRDLEILDIGPGQTLTQSRYLARHNRVTAMDLDVIPIGCDPRAYLAMLRQNGTLRVLKTLGRKALGVDRAHERHWRAELGLARLPTPSFVQGDISRGVPREAGFDLVVSWSAFEHIPDPEMALRNAIRALRPGGALFIGIHLYTSNSGHHDLRAFTGAGASLPLWGHLRPAQSAAIRPSAYLNGWRLGRWRDLFDQLAPGHRELLEPQGETELNRAMTPALRRELAEFSDDELFTDDALYVWRKPG